MIIKIMGIWKVRVEYGKIKREKDYGIENNRKTIIF